MSELQQVTNLFDMATDCKVTELFCITDEFCKHFDAGNACPKMSAPLYHMNSK